MLTHDQLVSLLKQQIKEAGSQKILAHRMGISQQFLTDVLKGRRMPGAKILRMLGYESMIMYKKIYQTGNEADNSERR